MSTRKKLINFRKWFGTYSEYQSVANATTTVRLLGFICKNGATAAAVLVQRLYQHASAARRNDTVYALCRLVSFNALHLSAAVQTNNYSFCALTSLGAACYLASQLAFEVEQL